ncbi:phosphatidylserine decarboxylase [Physcia stellaris]|nr:phosphatidylserine decarboxylase [Physcia stellaris]
MGCTTSRFLEHEGECTPTSYGLKGSTGQSSAVYSQSEDREIDLKGSPPCYSSVIGISKETSYKKEATRARSVYNLCHADFSRTPPKEQVDATRNIQSGTSHLLPLIQEFKVMIESDPQLFMLFHTMFEEAESELPLDGEDPKQNPHVYDYRTMLERLNVSIQQAPVFTDSLWAGFPVNFTLSRIMRTRSGQVAFLSDKVNTQLKKILDAWTVFLDSPESVHVLNDQPNQGWFSEAALKTMPHFVEDFECDPSRPHYGYQSWNAFFTRPLRPGARPVACPEDNSVIVNACESSPYRLAFNVQATDSFWLKGQPYSLNHMLADDPLATQFHGGTIFQSYLSQFNYHRWHSPVSGRIVKTHLQPGSYFSNAPMDVLDAIPPNGSQPYLTAVATRAMIYIEADNPDIGLLCFLPVGIAEVSSCNIAVVVGQRVRKGEQLGTFGYGGSTYCLLFRPQTRLEFDIDVSKAGKDPTNILVNARIAKATRS